MHSSPGGGDTGTAPAAAAVLAGTGTSPAPAGTTSPYEWTQPEPQIGFPLSVVAIWRHGRWQTIALCAHPRDAADLAVAWSGEYVVEIWARRGLDAPRRALHLEPAPGRE